MYHLFFAALLTVNFQNEPNEALNKLLSVQPNKPPLVMEYWTGWFDHWGRPHLERSLSPSQLVVNIGTILQMGGSFNLYMFHGIVMYYCYCYYYKIINNNKTDISIGDLHVDQMSKSLLNSL